MSIMYRPLASEFQNIITNPYNLYNKHFHVHFKDQSTVVEKSREFCKRHSPVIKAMILSQVCRFYNFFLLFYLTHHLDHRL